MSLFTKILRLKFRLYPLYIETFFIAGVVRLLIFFVPFKRLLFLLGNAQENALDYRNQKLYITDEIKLAISRVAKYTPWRCQCFEQGLTAKILLRQWGIHSTLVFGVTHTQDKTMMAHAWLQCGDTIVTGGEGSENFKVIASFS